ncbi:monooxygenase [Coniosporium tulheliwenetii]|uniref:Monooxygenase n=1 Tax=Coniosporium tulheliwenetii TaxID=3383036 RepID=A0ACC2YY52_9PEZI|nr:monooxygenase [Cladosporium sp. JES 115]
MSSPVIVEDYNIAWPSDFEAIRAQLWPTIHDSALATEHVGSTAVPGLAAKPIIDIDIVVKSPEDSRDVIMKLQSLGYKHLGNKGIVGREAFLAPAGAIRQNLYVSVEGCVALRNHLLLRDHLRKDGEAREEYGQLKKQLAARYPEDVDRYCEAKTGFILGILKQYGLGDEELRGIEEANKVAGDPSGVGSCAFDVKSIAIIGAGPSGLAAAKFLLAEKAFRKIDVFEQRSTVGGVWNYTPEDQTDVAFTVPSTDPHVPIDEPIWHEHAACGDLSSGSSTPNGSSTTTDSSSPSPPNGAQHQKPSREAQFISPMYERLETNIPKPLMRFSDTPFPEHLQLFPKHQDVEDYLIGYSRDVQHLIHFQTQVVSVRPTSTSKWHVTTSDLFSGQQTTALYDAVIVASGHFAVPYVPAIPGLEDWNAAYPGAISHSKFYRRPENFRGRKVVVVGNGASGLDIGSQIAQYCAQPLLVSQKSESYMSPGKSTAKLELPPIRRFISSGRAVEFEDGRVERDIDAVVFCTGYLYSLPFLEGLDPPLITDGERVEQVYQHLFYIPRPTLSLLVLPQRIIPFPVAEIQAAVVARVYSNTIALPSVKEMRDWERKGKDGEEVGEWEFWARERFPAIRRAFVERGEERAKVTKLEEIGFDFEKWKEEERCNRLEEKRI